VDLAGLILSDGSPGVEALVAFQAGPTELAPGNYGVIVDSQYDGSLYDIPAGTVLVTTADTNLGNGLSNNDAVEIRTAAGAVIDRFGFPSDPGSGVSIEKARLTGGDHEDNWAASCDGTGSTPGERNCQDENQAGGNAVLGEPCPSGSFDCAGGMVCLVNQFNGSSFCATHCGADDDPCPEDDFTCVPVADFEACVPNDEFREQNGQVGSPCPNGDVDCFSERCLSNPRTRIAFCTDACESHDECPGTMVCANLGPPDAPDLACIPMGLLRQGITGDPCPHGAIDCLSLLCLQPVDEAPYCTVDCGVDAACPPGLSCDVVGDRSVCFVDVPCAGDLDCEADEICEAGDCVPAQCGVGLACPAGQACLDGRCFEVVGTCDAPEALELDVPLEGDSSVLPATHGATCGGGGRGREVVAVLRLDDAARVRLTTEGSAFDTVLHVRTDCADPDSEAACNDDDPELGLQSELVFDAVAAQDYYVFIDAFSEQAGGVFRLLAEVVPADFCGGDADCEPGEICEAGECISLDDGDAGAGEPDAG